MSLQLKVKTQYLHSVDSCFIFINLVCSLVVCMIWKLDDGNISLTKNVQTGSEFLNKIKMAAHAPKRPHKSKKHEMWCVYIYIYIDIYIYIYILFG